MGFNKQQIRNEHVLRNLIEMSNEDDENAEMIADFLDGMLDDIQEHDGFGTECQ
jgi:hypothetical protein